MIMAHIAHRAHSAQPLRAIQFSVRELPVENGFAACPHCGTDLDLHQPDLHDLDRMIAICPECRLWFLLDELSGLGLSSASVLAMELPRLRAVANSKQKSAAESSSAAVHFSN